MPDLGANARITCLPGTLRELLPSARDPCPVKQDLLPSSPVPAVASAGHRLELALPATTCSSTMPATPTPRAQAEIGALGARAEPAASIADSGASNACGFHPDTFGRIDLLVNNAGSRLASAMTFSKQLRRAT